MDDILERLAVIEARLDKLEGKRAQSETTGFKLCYVEDGVAWFTTAKLEDQWGDDWNDAPYDCNAGTPYEWHERSKAPRYELCRIRYSGLATPADACLGSMYLSVEMINRGQAPWLTNEQGINIYAGASIEEFKAKVRFAGGIVYKEDME